MHDPPLPVLGQDRPTADRARAERRGRVALRVSGFCVGFLVLGLATWKALPYAPLLQLPFIYYPGLFDLAGKVLTLGVFPAGVLSGMVGWGTPTAAGRRAAFCALLCIGIVWLSYRLR